MSFSSSFAKRVLDRKIINVNPRDFSSDEGSELFSGKIEIEDDKIIRVTGFVYTFNGICCLLRSRIIEYVVAASSESSAERATK